MSNTTPQERLDALRALAIKENRLDALQQAVFEMAQTLLEPPPNSWFLAKELKPGKLFIRNNSSGSYTRVTPAGVILNSKMINEIFSRGDVFVVNQDSTRKTFFFISGDELVRYI